VASYGFSLLPLEPLLSLELLLSLEFSLLLGRSLSLDLLVDFSPDCVLELAVFDRLSVT